MFNIVHALKVSLALVFIRSHANVRNFPYPCSENERFTKVFQQPNSLNAQFMSMHIGIRCNLLDRFREIREANLGV